jgi:hypothetical protein
MSVQQLEDLLSRVQRNRARMDELGLGRRRKFVAASSSVAEETLPASETVETTPTMGSPVEELPPVDETMDEADFSAVSPASIPPEPVTEVQPPFASVPETDTSDFSDSSSMVETEDETDFSSASVPSVMPLSPDQVEVIDEIDEETTSVAEAAMPDETEAEELELVDSDTDESGLAAPVSIPAKSVEDVFGASPEELETTIQSASPEELSKKSFDETAVASGPVVVSQGAAPSQRTWTIHDTLMRALKLGQKE